MRKRLMSAASVLSVLLSAMTAAAQDRPRTVDEVVQLALERNRALLAARERVAESQGLLRRAGVRPNPTVEIDYGAGGPVGSPGTDELALRYAHPIELGGKRGKRQAIGLSGVGAAEGEFAERTRQLVFEVRTRAAEVQAAQAKSAALAGITTAGQEALRLMRARVGEGRRRRARSSVAGGRGGPCRGPTCHLSWARDGGAIRSAADCRTRRRGTADAFARSGPDVGQCARPCRTDCPCDEDAPGPAGGARARATRQGRTRTRAGGGRSGPDGFRDLHTGLRHHRRSLRGHCIRTARADRRPRQADQYRSLHSALLERTQPRGHRGGDRPRSGRPAAPRVPGICGVSAMSRPRSRAGAPRETRWPSSDRVSSTRPTRT